jgi:hypothetical protein
VTSVERDRDWTIYFRDGASEPPAVHPGHDRPHFDGWEAMEVVRADAYRGAVEALREWLAADDDAERDYTPESEARLAAAIRVARAIVGEQ